MLAAIALLSAAAAADDVAADDTPMLIFIITLIDYAFAMMPMLTLIISSFRCRCQPAAADYAMLIYASDVFESRQNTPEIAAD